MPVNTSEKAEEVTKHSVHTLVFRSQKRTHDMFISDQGALPAPDLKAADLSRKVKARATYGPIMATVELNKKRQKAAGLEQMHNFAITQEGASNSDTGNQEAGEGTLNQSNEVALYQTPGSTGGTGHSNVENPNTKALQPKRQMTMPKPDWHAPWKLFRVISGHTGWVRCVGIEPGNEWFCTGAADRVIKIWDLASGKLKLSLTGHVSTVRGLAVSARQPYLFSCGEDRQVKCWDLEYNKVVRHYHGHLSAVYDLALHPTIDVLVTCGRDSTARVWDMRTKVNIHTLAGHTATVSSVVCQPTDPQIITGSNDQTVRLWDLAAGKSMCTLTNHKKIGSIGRTSPKDKHVCISITR